MIILQFCTFIRMGKSICQIRGNPEWKLLIWKFLGHFASNPQVSVLINQFRRYISLIFFLTVSISLTIKRKFQITSKDFVNPLEEDGGYRIRKNEFARVLSVLKQLLFLWILSNFFRVIISFLIFKFIWW